MNMTKSAFLVAKSFRETVLPDTTSGNLKSTAVVPSGSMVDGVSDISYTSLPAGRQAYFHSTMIRELFCRMRVKGMRKDADYARTHYRYKAKRRPFSHTYRLA